MTNPLSPSRTETLRAEIEAAMNVLTSANDERQTSLLEGVRLLELSLNAEHERAEALARRLESLLAGLQASSGWQPIETAPERRKVFVTWVNALGKRRTALASYWPESTLEMADDVPDYQVTEDGKNLDAGWWEESEGNDEAMFCLVEKMTHWMPLPAPPTDALQASPSASTEQK